MTYFNVFIVCTRTFTFFPVLQNYCYNIYVSDSFLMIDYMGEITRSESMNILKDFGSYIVLSCLMRSVRIILLE